MWHPFRKIRLEPKHIERSSDSQLYVNPDIQKETEIAQLRSLKARTEIKMIYERLSEEALSKIKGHRHASFS